MTFIFVRSTIRNNGTPEVLSERIEKESIVLGRGSGCDVVLTGTQFSLTHARLFRESTSGSCFVEDLNSLSGVTVNGKLIKRSTLVDGDALGLGSLTFGIGISGAEISLRSEIREQESSEVDRSPLGIAQRFTLQSALPSIRALTLTAMIVVLATFLIRPLFTDSRVSWSSGGITNVHKPIEANCAACHQGNFAPVQDAQCRTCHTLSEHGAGSQHIPVARGEFEASERTDVQRSAHAVNSAPIHHAALKEQRCVTCHQEHNGTAALHPVTDGACTTCHAHIRDTAPKTELADVAAWDSHPKFVGGNTPIDTSHIKLNHKIHLQPDLRGATGPVTLTCLDCHQLSDDKRTMKPISRKAHCASCHSLGFEERLPAVEVPHAPPDVVYQFLYAQYAQLLLKDNDPVRGVTRVKPGAQESTPTEARRFANAEVDQLARKAERELFTRTACKLCHEVAPADVILPPTSIGGIAQDSPHSQFKVLAPEIPAVWMKRAVFNHGSHDNLSCQSCHGSVEKSEHTADANLPTIDSCRSCHAGHPAEGKVESSCTSCHRFHDSLPLAIKNKVDAKRLLEFVKAP